MILKTASPNIRIGQPLRRQASGGLVWLKLYQMEQYIPMNKRTPASGDRAPDRTSGNESYCSSGPGFQFSSPGMPLVLDTDIA